MNAAEVKDLLICFYADLLRVEATLDKPNKELDFLILKTRVRLNAAGVNVDELKY